MHYKEGLVSVVIPTYQRADLLTRAVESVLNQTYKNIECIVVNDNIPNDQYSVSLYKLLSKYKSDQRFRFIEQEKHINGAEARNCGIRTAVGEYIAFLDDDDWWEPEKIEKQVNFIRQQNVLCGGVSTLVVFYSKNKPVRWTLPYKDGNICKEILRREIDITTCSILLKHEALDKTGYFDNSLKRHQEIQLLAFFSSKYELKLLPEYLTCVNYESTSNLPNSEMLRKIKQDFFISVEPVMKTFSVSEQKRIKALHQFELAYVYYNEKKYGDFLKNAIMIFRDFKTLYIALKRVIERKKEYRYRPKNN